MRWDTAYYSILAYCKQSKNGAASDQKLEPGRPGNEASILRYGLRPFNFQEERAKTQAQLKWKPFSEL